GLAAVGADLHAPWVRRAIDWLLARQNPDGGWGEGPASYRDPSLAGLGPSMPPLTGLVLAGLLDIGEGHTPAVARGVRYLLDQQRPAGDWPNGGYLHTYIPPDSFYHYPEADRFYPLEALGRYLAWRQGRPAPRTAGIRLEAVPGQLRDDFFLDAMRQQGDPEAEAVVRRPFDRGAVGAVNDLLARCQQGDDAVPAGLPAEAGGPLPAAAPVAAPAGPRRAA